MYVYHVLNAQPEDGKIKSFQLKTMRLKAFDSAFFHQGEDWSG
jgi:hypothetical protein